MDWAPVSQRIWDMKYRFRDESGRADSDVDATWWRVARALAAVDEVRAKTTAFDKAGEGAKDRLFGRGRYAA